MKFVDDAYELDDIDRQLLEELQDDAKISLKKVGERVGLSAPAAMERVRKLEQAGVITGYFAQVDARRVGLDISAFIGVDLRSDTIPAFEEWADAVAQILECHHITGGHTLLLKVKTRNTRALEKLISRIRALPGVEATETMVVLSTHTERTQIPLDFPDEPPYEARRGGRARRKAS